MNSPYRIVMVAACPYPTSQGTQVYIRGLCRALVAAGHEVHLVTYPFGEDHLEPCGAVLHRTPSLPGYSKLRAGPGWGKPLLGMLLLRRLVQVIGEVEPDLIHAHNYEGQLAACLARGLTGLPVVYSAHNLMEDELESYFDHPISRGLARRVAGMLDRELPRRADRCVTLSRSAVPALVDLGLESGLIHPILPGVHSDDFPPARRSPRGPGPSPRVVYAGNPDSYQDLELLFAAMVQVVREIPEARLRLVSSAPLGPTLAQAERCGLSSDFIEVFVERNWTEVSALLRVCQVAALPRRICRGFPIKLINYRALGLPVVACAGAAEGIRDGEDGLVVPFDVDSFAGALLSLLDEPERADRMGEAARTSTFREHRWELRVPEFERVYAATLGAHSSLRRTSVSGRCRSTA